jgi:hypothetical protein
LRFLVGCIENTGRFMAGQLARLSRAFRRNVTFGDSPALLAYLITHLISPRPGFAGAKRLPWKKNRFRETIMFLYPYGDIK